MSSQLQAELKQAKPFPSLEAAAAVGLARTAAVVEHAFAEALRPHGITPTQYNVLRILRGSEPDGLCRNALRDRMLSRMPDICSAKSAMRWQSWSSDSRPSGRCQV